MATYTIILTSITYVYKAKNILENDNIRSYIVKIKSTAERRGCNYGLDIYGNYLQNAVNLIEANNIKIVEIIAN